ncbi:unnamed protein product [Linum trigynum]|uniref:Uncharacterized protein n=1 Tax=Linum trigynum TaxID=586398 RepID=A0AAV2CWQ9_9ROSI
MFSDRVQITIQELPPHLRHRHNTRSLTPVLLSSVNSTHTLVPPLSPAFPSACGLTPTPANIWQGYVADGTLVSSNSTSSSASKLPKSYHDWCSPFSLQELLHVGS